MAIDEYEGALWLGLDVNDNPVVWNYKTDVVATYIDGDGWRKFDGWRILNNGKTLVFDRLEWVDKDAGNFRVRRNWHGLPLDIRIPARRK